MGGSSSTEAKGKAPSQTVASSTSSSASSTSKVVLNVYSPSGGQHAVYHSGVEVLGAEYVFGGGDTSYSGVTPQRPKVPPPGSGWVFYQSVEIGAMTLSKNEALQAITEMQREFPARSYDLLSRNCNHFSDALCQRLCGKSIPSWVNRMAGIGNTLGLANTVRSAVGAPAASAVPGAKAEGAGGPAAAGLVARAATADGELTGEVDWAGAGVLNAKEEDAIGALRGGGIVSSEEGPELLFLLPLTAPVKLQSFRLEAPDEASAPLRARLFANERNLDMDDAGGGVAATQEVDLAWSPAPGGGGAMSTSIEVKFLKFQNLSFFSMHLSRGEEDEADIIAVRGLQLFGKV